jgi:hypothetical protein
MKGMTAVESVSISPVELSFQPGGARIVMERGGQVFYM